MKAEGRRMMKKRTFNIQRPTSNSDESGQTSNFRTHTGPLAGVRATQIFSPMEKALPMNLPMP
jgi:hypothetical protein